MRAIVTKYHGPTNSRGSRITAKPADGGPSVTVPYDHALDSTGNHKAAAQALTKKLNWGGTWVGGGTKTGMVFVDKAGDSFGRR